MNPVLILPLVEQLSELTLKIITIMEDAKDVSPEESELIKLRMKEARDRVTYIKNDAPKIATELEEYPAKLKNLYDTSKISEQEYIANMNVYNAATELGDNTDLVASLERTIKRHEK